METKLISTGILFSELPEGYIRPVSDRPNFSEVSESENVPVIDLGSQDGQLLIQQTAHACEEYGSFQIVDVAADDDQRRVLDADNDDYGGVVVDLRNHEHMNSDVFATLLQDSLHLWKQQGKKGVWIKLPINLVNLVDAAVKAGFRYHHSERTYLMLVYSIPETAHTPPSTATRGVRFHDIVNSEVLVDKSNYVRLNGTRLVDVSSLGPHGEAVESLLEIDQEVVQMILESKRDTWKNPELFNLVDNSLKNLTALYNFNHSLVGRIDRTRDSQFNLESGLQQFDGVELLGPNIYSQLLPEIEKFIASGDPFGNDFSLLFQPIYGDQMIILNKLQAEKFKLDKKLRSIKGWRKLSNVLFVVTFTSVLVCSVVAAATAAPVLTALAAAASVPIGSMGKWVDSICSKYENEVKAKLDFIGSMELRTFIVIKDLDNIRVLVNKLKSKMDALLQTADFALMEGEAVELAVDEIKKELSEFAQEIEDLSHYADKFNRDVGRARTMILQKMIAYPSA